MFDDFEILPEYTLDEVDKKIDILDNIVRHFADSIESAKDTLDEIDVELKKHDDFIETSKDKVRSLYDELQRCQHELLSIDFTHNVLSLSTLNSEETKIHKEIKRLNKLIIRKNESKHKLIQSASNLLYSINIHLNQLKQVNL